MFIGVLIHTHIQMQINQNFICCPLCLLLRSNTVSVRKTQVSSHLRLSLQVLEAKKPWLALFHYLRMIALGRLSSISGRQSKMLQQTLAKTEKKNSIKYTFEFSVLTK